MKLGQNRDYLGYTIVKERSGFYVDDCAGECLNLGAPFRTEHDAMAFIERRGF